MLKAQTGRKKGNLTTDHQIQRLARKDKSYKRSVGGGLFIVVSPKGKKYWRQAYKFNNKARTYSIGAFPVVKIQEAKEIRDSVKRMIFDGVDPAQDKVNKKIESAKLTSFEDVFNEWVELRLHEWSKGHYKRTVSLAKNHIFKHLKNIEISHVTTQLAVDIIKKVESTDKLSTAKRVRHLCERVFRYAKTRMYIENSPFSDLSLDVFKKPITKSRPFISDPKELSALLNNMDDCNVNFSADKAILLAPHVFLRPNELIQMEWVEVDFDTHTITIPEWRMKSGVKLIVHMSEYVLSIFKELYKYNSEGKYVFTSPHSTDKHINLEAVTKELTKAGYKDRQVHHGFRHTASTLLNESGFPADCVELQLAHIEKNSSRRAYNYVLHLDERAKMMEKWSSYLLLLKDEKFKEARKVLKL